MNEIYVVIKKVKSELTDAELAALTDTLYPERREAVLRLRNRKAAVTSIAAGRLLQEIIERECGIKPENLYILRGEFGKPYIEGYESFYFNLSHSNEYVAVAYGNVDMGIDIEKISDRDIKVAKRCFTEEEYKYIAGEGYKTDSESGDENAASCPDERFYHIWTMKESYLKCTGTGISVPLNSFCVNPYSLAVENTEYVFDRKKLDDYIVSVCTKGRAEIKYAAYNIKDNA